MTTKPTESPNPNTFAGRKAEREAAGESPPRRPRGSIRAGVDEPHPPSW